MLGEDFVEKVDAEFCRKNGDGGDVEFGEGTIQRYR